jgi:hypothetical protein
MRTALACSVSILLTAILFSFKSSASPTMPAVASITATSPDTTSLSSVARTYRITQKRTLFPSDTALSPIDILVSLEIDPDIPDTLISRSNACFHLKRITPKGHAYLFIPKLCMSSDTHNLHTAGGLINLSHSGDTIELSGYAYQNFSKKDNSLSSIIFASFSGGSI